VLCSVANAKGSALRKCFYNFPKDQFWCRTSQQLQFINETQRLVDTYESSGLELPFSAPSDGIVTSPHQSTSVHPPNFALSLAVSRADSGIDELDELDDHDHETHFARPKRSRLDTHVNDSDGSLASSMQSEIFAITCTNASRVDKSSSLNILCNSPTTQSTIVNPERVTQLGPSIPDCNLNVIASPVISNLTRIYFSGCLWPLQRKEEAVLMRHFVERLSICMDICDPNRHFALVVPHRASICPTLLNAIFACSARHLSRVGDLNPSIAEKYHQECLKHLIPMLSDGAALMDENLLAATVILRFFEEVQGS
jgi:hypothetical protein